MSRSLGAVDAQSCFVRSTASAGVFSVLIGMLPLAHAQSQPPVVLPGVEITGYANRGQRPI